MKPNAMLAIDLGASNGRLVWGSWTDDGLQMKEIHRFVNLPVTEDGLLCWDMKSLFGGITDGLRLCAEQGLTFDSIGLCSWGNTIGLLDERGELLRTPIHYRDPAPESALPTLYAQLGRRELFERTLFVPMTIQPTVVLRYFRQTQPALMQNVRTVLMISDLFNYLLCGRASSDRTMAATSQMVDMRNGRWNRSYMKELGLKPDWFPELNESGTPLAPLKEELAKACGLPNRPMVVGVSGHDTASAAGCIPMDDVKKSLYLSCGTWSCMGCRVPAAIEGEALYQSGATNDLGVFGQHHLRFNHTGLWIVQECRRTWKEEGTSLSFPEMMEQAAQSEPFIACIDTEDESFFLRDDMPRKVQAYCERTGQRVPEGYGQIMRVVLESLAFRYRYSADTLSALSQVDFDSMRVIGGGSHNKLLCQFAANALNKPILAGPAEASTIGNFMQQGVAMGTLASYAQALECAADAEPITTYRPCGAEAWERQYRKALALCGWKQIQTQ